MSESHHYRPLIKVIAANIALERIMAAKPHSTPTAEKGVWALAQDDEPLMVSNLAGRRTQQAAILFQARPIGDARRLATASRISPSNSVG
jgi:hypothetical protein